MQEVGSASTQALRSIQQAHQAAALNLATKGPTKTTTTLAISAAGRACLSRNHLGSPGGVEWQEGEEPRREREERASSALLPRRGARRLLLFLAAVEHGGPSVGCHKKSDLFSSLSPMKLLCFLLPGAEEGRRGGRRGGRTVVAVGQRSVAGSLSSAVPTESERSAHATTSDSEPRWKEPPERQRGRPRLPDLLGPAKRLGKCEYAHSP